VVTTCASTQIEVDYYRAGGILPVLRQLLTDSTPKEKRPRREREQGWPL
jgi:hypothetical protein